MNRAYRIIAEIAFTLVKCKGEKTNADQDI